MSGPQITPTDDQVQDALFGWLATLYQLPEDTDQIVRGFQNLVAPVPQGTTYAVINPGAEYRFDVHRRRYDPDNGVVLESGHLRVAFQLDCYGPRGADWAAAAELAWRSMWGVGAMASGHLTPLHADAPQAMNIVNAEGQFENRTMVRLLGQVNRTVALPQDYFSHAELQQLRAADLLS